MNFKLFPLLASIIALNLGMQVVATGPAVAKKSSGGSQTSTAGSQTSTGGATTAKAENKKDLTVKIVSISSPIKAGSDATATVQTDADALCKITVKYKSGPATAAGLKALHADSTGKATWTWKVAKNTAAGDWPVEITATSKGGKGSANGTLTIAK